MRRALIIVHRWLIDLDKDCDLFWAFSCWCAFITPKDVHCLHFALKCSEDLKNLVVPQCRLVANMSTMAIQRPWLKRWKRRYKLQYPDGGLPMGLPQPTPRVAEYLARRGIVLPGLPRLVVSEDTFIDLESDSNVAPTELDSDSDVLVAARVTWAVPEFVIIFIASVGKCKRLPAGRRGEREMTDNPPPEEDSEDEGFNDYPSFSETSAEEWMREQLYDRGCSSWGRIESLSVWRDAVGDIG